MALSERIKEARKNKSITQEELAKALNKTKNVISNWERGDNKPDTDNILKLCELLDINPSYLLEWKHEDCFFTSLFEQEHLIKYRLLDDYGKKQVDTTLALEYQRVSDGDKSFYDYDAALAYLTKTPIYAMGGINYEEMDEDELINFANDQFALEKKYIK